jgi:hypothetical protein
MKKPVATALLRSNRYRSSLINTFTELFLLIFVVELCFIAFLLYISLVYDIVPSFLSVTIATTVFPDERGFPMNAH